MDWFRASLKPNANQHGGNHEVVNDKNSPTMGVEHVEHHQKLETQVDLGDSASMIRLNKAKRVSSDLDTPNNLEYQAPRELDLELEPPLDKLTPKANINNDRRVSSLEMIEDEDQPKKATIWEKASNKCCGCPTTIWVATFAPLEMVVWVLYTFACLSFMTVKFLTLDDLVDHKITDMHGVQIVMRLAKDIKPKAISDVSGHIFVLKRGEKGGIVLNSGKSISKRSLAIIQGCGLDYITAVSADSKSKDLGLTLAFMLIGSVILCVGTISLFYVRGSDLQHSHEGRRFCGVYFLLQPFGLVNVVTATIHLYFDKRMCEFDYAYEMCCLRSVLFYFIIFVLLLKIPQYVVLLMHWKKLDLTIKRHREFRKSVVLQIKYNVANRKSTSVATANSATNKTKRPGDLKPQPASSN